MTDEQNAVPDNISVDGAEEDVSVEDIPVAEGTGAAILNDALTTMHDTISAVHHHIEHLRGDFDTKIKYDQSKDQVIDTLHRELTTYREGLVFNILRPLALDLLIFYDDATRLVNRFDDDFDPEVTNNPLTPHVKGMAEDIESILARYGFEIFQLEDDNFDKSQQRAQKRIETDDPDLDQTIAQRITCGLRYEDRIVRPETVTVYRFVAPDDEPES